MLLGGKDDVAYPYASPWWMGFPPTRFVSSRIQTPGMGLIIEAFQNTSIYIWSTSL